MNGLYQDDFIGKKKSLIGLFQDYEEDNQESRWPNYRLSYPKRAAIIAGGAKFLPTQLPNLVAWYKQQGVTTGYNGAASLVAATPSYFVLNSAWWVSNFPFTISVWVNPTSISGNQCIFDQFATGSDRLVVYLDGSGKINVGVNSYAAVLTSTATISAGVWSHIVCTYDGTTAQIIINNGTPRTGALQSITGTPNSGWWGNSNSAGAWTGLLDEGKIFSRIWSPTEVTADYASGNGVSTFPGDLAAAGISTSNYVAGYAFNGSGNLVHDYSGNGNTLSNTNSVTYTQGKVLTNNFIAGDGGGVTNTLGNQTTDGAASFASASSEKFSTSTLWFPSTGAASVSCWASFATLGTTVTLLANGQSTTSFYLGKSSTDKVGLSVNNAALSVLSSTVIADSNKHHIVGVYDGTNVSVYLDGNLVAGPTAQIMSSPSADTGTIGGFTASGFVNGTIDALTTYQGALTAGDVTKLYAADNGVAAKDTAALGLSKTATAGYDFDGPGNLTKDSIGSNTLTASATPPTYTAGQVASYIIADGDIVTTWQDQAAPPIKAQGAVTVASASSQYLNVANNSSLQTGGHDFWSAVWVNYAAGSGSNERVFCLSNGNNTQSAWEINSQLARVPQIEIFLSASQPGVHWGSALTAGTWHLVFMWVDSVAQIAYLNVDNGTAVSVSLGAAVNTGTSGLSLGARDDPAAYFNGSLDAAMYGVNPSSPLGNGGVGTLAATIQAALYASGNGLAAKDLTAAQKTAWGTVAGYDFDNSYNLGRDSIGTNTLTPVNAPTITTGQVKSSTIICGDQTTGNNLTQATAANRPVYKVNIQNGRPGVLSSTKSTSVKMSAAFTLNEPFTLTLVGQSNTDNTNESFTGGSAIDKDQLYSRANGKLTMFGTGNGAEVTIGTSAFISNAQFNGASSQINLNNGAEQAASITGVNPGGLTVFNDGGGATSSVNAYIFEVVVNSVVLSAAQQTQLYNYLKSLWATP